MSRDRERLMQDVLDRARRHGADAADAVLVESRSVSVARRNGQPEKLERDEGRDLGVRLFKGARQAIVSTTDLAPDAIEEAVRRAASMADHVPDDAFSTLADPALLARDFPDLQLEDPQEPDIETLIERACAAEAAALAVPGVTNSEGGEASWGRRSVTLASSTGFFGCYARTGQTIVASVLAGEGTGMERDHDYDSRVHGADLRPPEEIGRRAGERAVARLGAKKIASCKCPVVFDARIAGGLLSSLTGAINGAAIARRASFLQDRMGEAIFARGITIIDDPTKQRGLRSKPFDGEGVAGQRRALVEDGVLKTWLLDTRSANKLGLATTGHAARGTGGPPSPAASNVWMEPGMISRESLIGEIEDGILVTGLFGMGVNLITGDYSRGFNGFRIENGTVTYPISEVTLAGNLKEMFANLTPADDLDFRTGADAPSLRIDAMTVAGT